MGKDLLSMPTNFSELYGDERYICAACGESVIEKPEYVEPEDLIVNPKVDYIDTDNYRVYLCCSNNCRSILETVGIVDKHFYRYGNK